MSQTAAANLLRTLIRPVHLELQRRFGVPATPAADCCSVAAAYQETKCSVRDQGDPSVIGPATGFWQFEKNGGVAEILEAAQTAEIAAQLCADVGVAPTRDAVWRLFYTPAGDALACAFARLLYWKDRRALPPPVLESSALAYRLYDDNWRPSAKRPDDWRNHSWPIAVTVVAADSAEPPNPEPPSVPAGPSLEARVGALEARIDRIVAQLTSVR